MNLTKQQVIKECKDEARKYGLVFRKSNFNNLYVFHDRKTKDIVIANLTLGLAYSNVCSGYISCYDKETQSFNKVYLKNLGLIN